MIEPNFNNPNTSITRPTTIARAATLAGSPGSRPASLSTLRDDNARALVNAYAILPGWKQACHQTRNDIAETRPAKRHEGRLTGVLTVPPSHVGADTQQHDSDELCRTGLRWHGYPLAVVNNCGSCD